MEKNLNPRQAFIPRIFGYEQGIRGLLRQHSSQFTKANKPGQRPHTNRMRSLAVCIEKIKEIRVVGVKNIKALFLDSHTGG